MRSSGALPWSYVLVAGLLVSGDLGAGSLEPPGPPAPTMKTLDEVEAGIPISTLPYSITQPGLYYLTRNLTGVSGQVGIDITSSFVTLDLNGFSLIGVGGSLDGVRAQVAGTKEVAIRNGVIRNWGARGIAAGTTTQVHAEDLRLASNGHDGLSVGPGSIVRDTTSSANGGTGIYAESGSTVIGCTVMSNTGSGVVTGAGSLVSSTTALYHVPQYGIVLNTGSVAIDCIARQNTVGMSVGAASRVVHSVAQGNGTGILGSDRVSIEECTVEGNDDGIRTGSNAIVRGNFASGNFNDGIEVSSGTRLEDNQSTGNGVGFRVNGTNSVVVKNSAYLNTTSEYVIPGGNKAGLTSTNPATAGPWDNFDQ